VRSGRRRLWVASWLERRFLLPLAVLAASAGAAIGLGDQGALPPAAPPH
jgi:hypothetical protein